MLNDVDESFAIALFDRAIGGDGDEESRLFDASRPIDRQILAPFQEAIEHQLRPVERLAVGELNEFVHCRCGP